MREFVDSNRTSDLLVLPVIQKEIQVEVERRKMGKDVQDLKKKQEEERTKRLLEERNKEKAEEKAARERVRQQIALVRTSLPSRHRLTIKLDPLVTLLYDFKEN